MRYSHLIHSLLVPAFALSSLSCQTNAPFADSWHKKSKIAPISSYGSYHGPDPYATRNDPGSIPEWAKAPTAPSSQPVNKTAKETKITTPAAPQARQKIVVAPAKTKTATPASPAKKAAGTPKKPQSTTGTPSKYRGFTKRPPRAPAPTIPVPAPSNQE